MTSRPDFGNGDAYGGGSATGGLGGGYSSISGSWQNFPVPIGQHPLKPPHSCYGEIKITANGEMYGWPLPCGPWPPGSHLGPGDPGP